MEGMVDQPLTLFSTYRPYFRKIAFSLILVVLGFVLWVVLDEEWFTEKNLWAVAVFGLGLFPFIRWFYRGECWAFPVFELFSLFYSVCFGLSSLFIGEDISKIGIEERIPALQLTITGLLFAYWAYFGIGDLIFRRLQPLKIKNPASYAVIVKNAWFIAWLYLIYKIAFLNYGENIVIFTQPLQALGWLSNGIILTDILISTKIPLSKYAGLLVVIILQLLLGLASTALAQIAMVVVFFCLIYLNVRKKVLIKTIGIFVIAFIFANPVKHEMRLSIGEDSNKLNFVQKAGVFAQLLENPSKYSDIRGSSQSTISRLDHGGLMAEILSLSPKYVPFAWGQTYDSLFTIWIPRFLWPEKPMSSVGNEWAHWYGLLDSYDFTTSYNLPWIVEFYVNFGTVGVLLGMFLCGLGFSWLKVRLCSEQSSVIEYAVGAAILNQLWYTESNFALGFGGLVISSITFFFYFKFYRFLSIK